MEQGVRKNSRCNQVTRPPEKKLMKSQKHGAVIKFGFRSWEAMPYIKPPLTSTSINIEYNPLLRRISGPISQLI